MAEALAQAERKSRLHVFPTPSKGIKALIEDSSLTPDLILLDGGLVDQDSLELLRRVRAASDLCRVPIVMFTGFSGYHKRLRKTVESVGSETCELACLL